MKRLEEKERKKQFRHGPHWKSNIEIGRHASDARRAFFKKEQKKFLNVISRNIDSLGDKLRLCKIYMARREIMMSIKSVELGRRNTISATPSLLLVLLGLARPDSSRTAGGGR